MAQVPDIPWTLFLGRDSRMTPEMGGGATLTKEKCSSFSHRPHPVPPLLYPCLGAFPLLAFAPDTYLAHRNLFSSFIHVCMRTRLMDAKEGGRWRVRAEGLRLVLAPSLELPSPMTGLLSLCTRLEAESEKMISGPSGYHLSWQTQDRAHQRQSLTDCFYYISCHKTHFLGGYTPASPPLSFCSPLP